MSWDGPSPQEPERGHEVTVDTVAELDKVLSGIIVQAAADEVPYAVQICRVDQQGAIMMGVGHPERSFIDWLDRDQPHGTGNRYGVQPDLSLLSESIGFDVYGNWIEVRPARTRVASATARAAAEQYLRTGDRPTNIEWSAG